MLELIGIQELLRDPDYRAYFTKVPKLPEHYRPENQPWKLLVLKSGERSWRSKRFGTYAEAFAGFKKMLPTIENAAINCPPLAFMPPIRTVRIKGQLDKKGNQLIRTLVWKPKIDADMDTHHWCPHCRRPSIFRMMILPATKYLTLPQTQPELRCIICGISNRTIDLRHPENHQQWDINRPKVHS